MRGTLVLYQQDRRYRTHEAAAELRELARREAELVMSRPGLDAPRPDMLRQGGAFVASSLAQPDKHFLCTVYHLKDNAIIAQVINRHGGMLTFDRTTGQSIEPRLPVNSTELAGLR